MKRYVFIFLIMAAASSQISAQASTQTVPAAAIPEPWKTEELPLWVKDASRFLVVSLGSYPFTLFFANEGMDFYRFFGNDFESAYAPWPFKNEYSYQPSQDETISALVGAGFGALAVGIADFVIHRLILNSGE